MQYKPNKVAQLTGVSVRTLQRWDKEGVFIAQRTPNNRRYYTEEQLTKFIPKLKENINTINAIVTQAIEIKNKTNKMYISKGMVVTVFTNGIDFKEEYTGLIKSVDEYYIVLEGLAPIKWEYITSIGVNNL